MSLSLQPIPAWTAAEHPAPRRGNQERLRYYAYRLTFWADVDGEIVGAAADAEYAASLAAGISRAEARVKELDAEADAEVLARVEPGLLEPAYDPSADETSWEWADPLWVLDLLSEAATVRVKETVRHES